MITLQRLNKNKFHTAVLGLINATHTYASARAQTHTHTHTHIYIYPVIRLPFMCLSQESATHFPEFHQ